MKLLRLKFHNSSSVGSVGDSSGYSNNHVGFFTFKLSVFQFVEIILRVRMQVDCIPWSLDIFNCIFLSLPALISLFAEHDFYFA